MKEGFVSDLSESNGEDKERSRRSEVSEHEALEVLLERDSCVDSICTGPVLPM